MDKYYLKKQFNETENVAPFQNYSNERLKFYKIRQYDLVHAHRSPPFL
jgi:hypothetical protein